MKIKRKIKGEIKVLNVLVLMIFLLCCKQFHKGNAERSKFWIKPKWNGKRINVVF